MVRTTRGVDCPALEDVIRLLNLLRSMDLEMTFFVRRSGLDRPRLAGLDPVAIWDLAHRHRILILILFADRSDLQNIACTCSAVPPLNLSGLQVWASTVL